MAPILFRLLRGHSRKSMGQPPWMADSINRPVTPSYLRIFGVTKDSSGSPLASCVVTLYRTLDDVELDKVTSDASGNYEFRSAGQAQNYYVVAYKAGSPDVAGTTVNTLIGV